MEDISGDGKINVREYMNFHLALLELGMMWPVRKFQRKFVNNAIQVFFLISSASQIIFLMMELSFLLLSMAGFLEIIAYVGIAAVRIEAVGKLAYMIIIRSKLKSLVDSLDNCLKLSTRVGSEKSISQSTEELVRSTMKPWSSKAKTIAIIWLAVWSLGSIQWTTVPFVLNGETTIMTDGYHSPNDSLPDNVTEWFPMMETIYVRILPFKGWFPFDHTASPMYEILFVIQGIGNLGTCAGVAIFDQFYCALLLILCGQFHCLKKALENIKMQNKATATKYSLNTIETKSYETRNKIASNMPVIRKDDSIFREDPLDELNLFTTDAINTVSGDYLSGRNVALRQEEMETDLKACIRHHQCLRRYVYRMWCLCYVNA